MSTNSGHNLHFAPALTISMVEDTLLIDLEGILSDWDAYTFSLDITSPGKKRIVVRIKHPEFHTYRSCCPRVRGPDVELIPLENITLEFLDNFSQESEDPESCNTKEERSESDLNDTLLLPKSEDVDSRCIKTKGLENGNVKLEDSTEDAKDHDHTLASYTVSPFPCRVLTRHTKNPSPRDYAPSKKWKYYIHSFDPSILAHEIAIRKEIMENVHERENKCLRLE